MADATFGYPGSKTRLFDWISDHFVAHRTWVDVFGGSGVVTANKEPSKVEVYNDLDGDLVHFFVTLRDNPDELAEWLSLTPHSRELHAEYVEDFYNGVRPSDDIERAGRFFYLRYTQWGQKYESKSTYANRTDKSPAKTYQNSVDKLKRWARRFQYVQIEQMDCIDLIQQYDTPDTLFYCDPPYLDEGDDLYSHGTFDHKALCDALIDAEGDWLVSYTRIPEPLRETSVCVSERESRVTMTQGGNESDKTNTERLVMNYDPNQRPAFSCSRQATLDV